jgi:hypothetical protein
LVPSFFFFFVDFFPPAMGAGGHLATALEEADLATFAAGFFNVFDEALITVSHSTSPSFNSSDLQAVLNSAFQSRQRRRHTLSTGIGH